jgi:GMP synthase (glutamine-hydrolysing)
MPAPRLLVIEGNTPENRANHVAAGGTVASAGYAALLQELLPSAIVDICFPADPGANLPNGQALEGYDGVAITGSGLHVYEPSPAVTNQIELTRAALKSGTPVFGSCWGLQVLTVAAGGVVRKNPKGREIGFGRRIKLTEPGRKHPMYVGKPEVFNAPTVHLDEVETIAPGTTILATNEVSDVQSAEIRCNGAVAWGVQYHPEYPLREIAAIVRRIGLRLIDEGFFLDTREIASFADDLATLDRNPAEKRLSWRYGISKNVLEKKLRTGEVANWLQYQVLPTRAKRGRG